MYYTCANLATFRQPPVHMRTLTNHTDHPSMNVEAKPLSQ